MSDFQNSAKTIWEKLSSNITKEKLDSISEKSKDILSTAASSDNLSKLMDKIKLLLSMIKDYIQGNYKDIPWKSISSIAAALLYLVMPIDAIPDFIMGLGFLDDAFIIGLAIKFFGDDIEKYRIWKYGDNQEISTNDNQENNNNEDNKEDIKE